MQTEGPGLLLVDVGIRCVRFAPRQCRDILPNANNLRSRQVPGSILFELGQRYTCMKFGCKGWEAVVKVFSFYL
jgi:hypothetical protein